MKEDSRIMKKTSVILFCSILVFSSVATAENDKELSSNLNKYLTFLEESKEFSGTVLLAKDDKIIFHKAFGHADIERKIPNTKDTQFNIASVSKQFTAAAILMLEDQGKLSTNDTLSIFLPDYPNGEKITIHHLLTHSSGVPNYTRKESYESKRTADMSVKEAIDWFKNDPLDFEPGTRNSYSNSGYLLLAHIVEIVSGKSFYGFLKSQIFDPLGMTNTGQYYDKPSSNSQAKGYDFGPGGFASTKPHSLALLQGNGSLASTTEDLYKWYTGLTTGKLLTKSSLDRMLSNLSNGWGYGWSVRSRHGFLSAAHDGRISGFFSYIAHYPTEKTCVIFLSNVGGGSLGLLRDDLPAIVFGQEFAMPELIKEFVTVEPQILEKYVGRYNGGDNFWFDIIVENGHLHMLWLGRSKGYLAPLSDKEFYFRIRFEKLTFIENDQGTIDRVVWKFRGRDIPLQKVK